MLAAFFVSTNDPEAVPLPRMVSLFPFIRQHRTSSYLNYQITNGETSLLGHAHEINVRPL
jgi:hypothetical protein